MKKNVNRVSATFSPTSLRQATPRRKLWKPARQNLIIGVPAILTSPTSWTSRPCDTGKCCSWRRFLVMRSSGSAGEMHDMHTKYMKMEDNAYE